MIVATISGHIGRDAETKQAGQSTVTEFTLASSEKVRDDKVTTWVRCQVWDKRGTALQASLTKGKQLTVVGKLTLREYEKDGQKRISPELRVDHLDFGGSPRTEGQQALPKSGGREPWEDHF